MSPDREPQTIGFALCTSASLNRKTSTGGTAQLEKPVQCRASNVKFRNSGPGIRSLQLPVETLPDVFAKSQEGHLLLTFGLERHSVGVAKTNG